MIYRREFEEALERTCEAVMDHGWRKTKDIWICPDCVTEVRGRQW